MNVENAVTLAGNKVMGYFSGVFPSLVNVSAYKASKLN